MSNKLPLVDYASSLNTTANLENVLLVTCQHMLESNQLTILKMIEQGLKPANIFWLGKVYSTNNEIYEEIQAEGIFVHPASIEFDSHISFDEHHQQAAANMWQVVKKKVDLSGFQKVVVLDDGGQLILEAHKQVSDLSNFAGVEWTSAGFNAIAEAPLRFPAVNMARSEAKLHLESPFIAELVVSELLNYIKLANPKANRILVIGGGFIGANVASQLRANFDVKRFDVVSEKSELTRKELDEIIHEFDVIVGATGKTIMGQKEYSLLKEGVILASCSSSDREFDAVALRQKISPVLNPHENLVINGVHLMRCGFPITFDGSRQKIPFSKIQLTSALVYSSTIQALTTSSKGLQDLNKDTQQKLINKFTNLLSDYE